MDNPKFHGRLTRQELDAMSVQELTLLLEQLLDGLGETEDDTELQACLDALDRKEPAPVPDVQAELEALWGKVAQTLPPEYLPSRAQPEEQAGGRPDRRPKRLGRLMRPALAAVLAVVLTFGGMIVAQAAGLDAFGAVARWTDQVFNLYWPAGGEPSPLEDAQATYDRAWFGDHQEELVQAGVDLELLPTWAPGECEMREFQITTVPPDWITMVYGVFLDAEGREFSLFVDIYNDVDQMGNFYYEKDDTPVQTFQINGRKIYRLENLGEVVFVCQQENVIYTVCGDGLPDWLALDIMGSIGAVALE